ncbi:glycoside hydrolase family 15 protein [Hydrogenophaga sp. BPS33]|uniref:glycoside hydrolase family 15 protein n=1 Tax=Hydrogenophaga sp. BPS33 TaxID=2651974 RepID=UPI00131FB121|nr:glycoside hydrolase family 15 protein [Hydrogenophaga sp. BPS33]QHE84235.1 glycoside hydrolase family 15 protein [Hydrogenophaga sp. BPS33]
MNIPGFAPPAAASLSLGMVGNCAFSALIDPHGRVVWSCLPRFDGDPVFHALLGGDDREQGSFAIEIENLAEATQRYEHNTAVLITELWDRDGNGLSITDFAPRFRSRGRYFRPTQLVRRVRPIKGTPRVRISMLPRFDWGRETPTITSGSNHIRYVGEQQTLRLHTDASISHVLARQPFLLLREHNFVLGPDETLQSGIGDTARHFEQETLSYWRDWTRRLAIPLEWQEAVIRAAITLKLSLYEDTGAIIAAMTTSIPEAPGTQRNWDYRYCWLRDAFFVVRALNSLSEVGTMEDYLRWLANVVVGAGGGHIQPLHGIGLERELPERICDTLPGYRGMGPVRVGNQAQEHFQHDVYGNIVLAASQAFHDQRLLHRAGRTEFEQLERVGERAVLIYDKPDAGMWELRTRARVHTSSVLMCWAACDRLAKIARTLKLPDREAYWERHANTMRERILNESWNEERQAFAESFGGRDLDASVLLMVEVGMIDPKDPRFVSTLDALEKHLCDGPYMRRYEAADDFGKPETAFNICTFWRIDALARMGRKDEARAIFETMLAARNPLGMLSEDTHATTGEMWGNFPQTYSMVGIINAAVRLSARWDAVI